jgi:2-keto-4-pentenoate hydratase
VSERAERAAALLRDHRLARRPIDHLPADCRPRDLAEGYAVQDALHRLLAAAGQGARVGYKIGCTTPVMQAYLGIPHPCAGGMLAAGLHHGRARLAAGDFVRVGVECEIAVRLGRDLPAGRAPFDRDTVGGAVDACLAAMEIVDDRYADYRALGVPTLIADDFFHTGCVLGPPVAAWRGLDLLAARGRTTVNGHEVGHGEGRAIMDDPLLALAWLADGLAARGRALRAGEVVLLGSVVQTRWLAPGDRATIAVEGLGEARFELGA